MEKSTKDKILEAANVLFAKNGFGGTSIRDIASEANVNLAAINYHFRNKENLYLKVFNYNYEWLEVGMQSLDEDHLSTAEYSVRVFRFFLEEKLAITNIFKIILSDHLTHFQDNIGLEDEVDEIMGPPGYELLMKKIEHEVGTSVNVESLRWAMKSVFTIISHQGLMMSTEYIKHKCKKESDLSPDFVEKEVYFAVEAIVLYLKSNSRLPF